MSITQNGALKRDDNDYPVMGGTSSADNATIINSAFDPVTRRLLTDSTGGGGGTVTSVSVVTANGFAGTVATATTTPAITLTTTITSPVLAGNGTAISAGTTTGSGSTVVLNNSPVFVDDITLGVAAGATGSILFKGLTSGTVTLKVADAAGTYTLTLPTDDGDNGEVLTTNGSGVTSWEAAPAAALVVGTTTITSGTTTRILYDNAGVLGEYTITGTGTVVAMQTNPTLAGITMTDATNIVIDTTTGTKIGTAATQKIGFFNATPIVQPTGDIVTAMQNLGLGASLTVAGATTITVADEATDTSCFPVFVTAATGTLGPKTNANLTFNSNTGLLGAAAVAVTGSTAAGNSMYLPAANTLGWTINGTEELRLTGTALSPGADGGNSLGTTALGWQNLFGNTGFVVNIENGDWVATHTAGILTVGTGDLRVTTAGTNSASVVTVGGTQTLTNKTLTSPTINTATLGGAQQLVEGAGLRLDQTLSADGTWTGTTIAGTAGAALAFGDLIYLAVADSRWELTDADSVTTAGAVLTGFCVLAAAADGDPTVILLDGNIRADTAFPALTVGAPVYASTTPGDIQVAQPSGTDDVIHVVGFALTADSIVVRISPDYITHT